jgi:hypothetical protein
MATKFNLEHQFKQGVETVWAMYSDRAFFEKKYQETGCTNIEVLDYQKSAKGFSITVRYDTKSDAPIPEFAKKFIPQTISVVQTDAWDASTKTGRITTELKGMPIKVTADMKLEASGKGAVNKMAWTLASGIPLVGGKLEGILAEDVKVKSKRDEGVSQKLVEGY